MHRSKYCYLSSALPLEIAKSLDHFAGSMSLGFQLLLIALSAGP